jgi:hypothetical protein
MVLAAFLDTTVAAWEHDTAVVNKLVQVHQALVQVVEQLVTQAAVKQQQPVLL